MLLTHHFQGMNKQRYPHDCGPAKIEIQHAVITRPANECTGNKYFELKPMGLPPQLEILAFYVFNLV